MIITKIIHIVSRALDVHVSVVHFCILCDFFLSYNVK